MHYSIFISILGYIKIFQNISTFVVGDILMMKKLSSIVIICAIAIGYMYWSSKGEQPMTIFAAPGWETLAETFK